MPFSTAASPPWTRGPLCPAPEEAEVMERLQSAFLKCEKLQRHVRFLYTNGSLYKVYNGNLLYHGCVPLNNDGTSGRYGSSGRSTAARRSMIFWRFTPGRATIPWIRKSARRGGISSGISGKQELTGLWKRPDDHLREVFRGGT